MGLGLRDSGLRVKVGFGLLPWRQLLAVILTEIVGVEFVLKGLGFRVQG